MADPNPPTWEWVNEAYSEYLRRRGRMEAQERKDSRAWKEQMEQILKEQLERPGLLP